jgi:hypothetical protein
LPTNPVPAAPLPVDTAPVVEPLPVGSLPVKPAPAPAPLALPAVPADPLPINPAPVVTPVPVAPAVAVAPTPAAPLRGIPTSAAVVPVPTRAVAPEPVPVGPLLAPGTVVWVPANSEPMPGDALLAALPAVDRSSGSLAVALSGLTPVAPNEFAARAAVRAAGSSPASSRTTENSTPTTPGGSVPVAGIDSWNGNSGAGSTGSSGNSGIPLAVLVDADPAPTAFALSVLVVPEHRITWWYPEVVVGPG